MINRAGNDLRPAWTTDLQSVTQFGGPRPGRRRATMVIDEIQKQRTVLWVVTARRVIATGWCVIRAGHEYLDMIIRGWAGEPGQFGATQRDTDHVRGQALNSADFKATPDQIMPHTANLWGIITI